MIRKFSKYNYYSDFKEGLEIIYIWKNFHKNYNDKSKLNDSIDRWLEIPLKVRKSLEDDGRVPFWMVSDLRVKDFSAIKKRQQDDWGIVHSGSFIGLYDKTIANSQFPVEVWDDEKLYNIYCQDYHIYGIENKEKIWTEHLASSDRFKLSIEKETITKQKLDTDLLR
jgi:hypothetical protein